MSNDTCKFSVEFEIDGRKVSMSESYEYMPHTGLADKGFVFGGLMASVARQLFDHLNTDEWESFLLAICDLQDTE